MKLSAVLSQCLLFMIGFNMVFAPACVGMRAVNWIVGYELFEMIWPFYIATRAIALMAVIAIARRMHANYRANVLRKQFEKRQFGGSTLR